MTVQPSGSPFWGRTNVAATYGGSINKADYAGVAALGGDTDVSAVEFNRLPTDLEATSRTTPFAVVSYTTRNLTLETPLVSYVALPTGVYIGEPYDGSNPPTGFPLVFQAGPGTSAVLFDASYTDAYGVSIDTVINKCVGTINTLTIGRVISVVSDWGSTGYSIAAQCKDDAGVPVDDNSITMVAW